jgi:hypothetical protein
MLFTYICTLSVSNVDTRIESQNCTILLKSQQMYENRHFRKFKALSEQISSVVAMHSFIHISPDLVKEPSLLH